MHFAVAEALLAYSEALPAVESQAIDEPEISASGH